MISRTCRKLCSGCSTRSAAGSSHYRSLWIPDSLSTVTRPFRAREVFLGIYLRAPEYRLLASRRSTRSVTSAVEHIALHGRPEEGPSPYRGYVGQDERVPGVRLHVLSGRRNLEVAHVFRLAELSLDNGGAYSEIAAICLDNRQAAPLAAAFWARGVPYSIDPAPTKSARLLPISVSAAPVPCVQQLIFALRLLVNPFEHASFTDVVSMGLAPGPRLPQRRRVCAGYPALEGGEPQPGIGRPAPHSAQRRPSQSSIASCHHSCTCTRNWIGWPGRPRRPGH